jgi:hypothetical protein
MAAKRSPSRSASPARCSIRSKPEARDADQQRLPRAVQLLDHREPVRSRINPALRRSATSSPTASPATPTRSSSRSRRRAASSASAAARKPPTITTRALDPSTLRARSRASSSRSKRAGGSGQRGRHRRRQGDARRLPGQHRQDQLQGYDGQEIEDQLNAIFSSVGDQMAQRCSRRCLRCRRSARGCSRPSSASPRNMRRSTLTLKSIGRTFGAVGVGSIAARDALVQLFGGLDDFVSATDSFRDKFLSDAEQIAPIQAAVIAELQRLGVANVTTREQFKNLVLGLDLTTDAGRQMYASLLAVAPAFDKVLGYFDSSTRRRSTACSRPSTSSRKFADSLRKYRDTLFDTGATQQATTALSQGPFRRHRWRCGHRRRNGARQPPERRQGLSRQRQAHRGLLTRISARRRAGRGGRRQGHLRRESTADYASSSSTRSRTRRRSSSRSAPTPRRRSRRSIRSRCHHARRCPRLLLRRRDRRAGHSG